LRTSDLPEPRVSEVDSEGAARAPGSSGGKASLRVFAPARRRPSRKPCFLHRM